MTRSIPIRRTDRRQALAAEIDTLQRRLAKLEHEQVLLRNTLCGLARETDVAVGGTCSDCDRSYLFIDRGVMYCPKCRTQRAI